MFPQQGAVVVDDETDSSAARECVQQFGSGHPRHAGDDVGRAQNFAPQERENMFRSKTHHAGGGVSRVGGAGSLNDCVKVGMSLLRPLRPSRHQTSNEFVCSPNRKLMF